MLRRPPRSTPTDPLGPYTTPFRSRRHRGAGARGFRRHRARRCHGRTGKGVMAFASRVFDFTTKASTGAQAIPHGGPSEVPSLVIMFGSAKSDAATAGNFYRMMIGAATGPSNCGYVGVIESENTSPGAAEHILKTDKLFGTINSNGTILNERTLVTMEATNINVNWTTRLAVPMPCLVV